jgi:methylglutaconyl-CoA hydratase
MPQLVDVERRTRSIREIILRRAESRNALSLEMLEQLFAALNTLAADSEVRVVILRADGPVFSAGLDLKEAADDTLAERSAASLKRVFEFLRETPLVMIAAVQGGAYAGGAGLMAACDIVVAANDVNIGFPEARRGLLPALISQILRPKVRDGDLRELFLTGEPIDARRALQIGLVQRVVSGDGLLAEVRFLANAVVSGAPETIRQTKQLLNDLIDPSRDTSEAALETLHLAARHSAEAREGLAAFKEKRNPNWIQEGKLP